MACVDFIVKKFKDDKCGITVCTEQAVNKIPGSRRYSGMVWFWPTSDHADEAQRRIAQRLELVLLVRLDKHRIARADLAPLYRRCYAPAPMGRSQRRAGAGGFRRPRPPADGEVANDEIFGFIPSDQHPSCEPAVASPLVYS